MNIFEIFEKGGPMMWPLLLTSVIATSVVVERIIFMVREKKRRSPETVNRIFKSAEEGDLDSAVSAGGDSRDFVARALVYGLAHRGTSFSSALLHAANLELKCYSQGIVVLDTIITLAPLLGLLGTVTGMMHSFSLLGGQELDAPAAITGGIAEALIATAFGLGIAIISLIPFNFLNARLEEARHEIEDASNHLELILMQQEKRV